MIFMQGVGVNVTVTNFASCSTVKSYRLALGQTLAHVTGSSKGVKMRAGVFGEF
jgi:hypothetical protein